MFRLEIAQIAHVVPGIVQDRVTVSAHKDVGIIVMDQGRDVGSRIIGNV